MSDCTCSSVSGLQADCPQHGMDVYEGEGRWVKMPPQVEGQCSWPPCTNQATWTRKDGWMVAPGSPDGDVCEEHHCWRPLRVAPAPPGKHHRPLGEALCENCWPSADAEEDK